MVFFNSSYPSVLRVINFLSSNPSLIITFINPLNKATSVPGRCLNQRVAYLASSISRGSATINFAPFLIIAFLISRAIMGWFSVVLEPVK
ncbi:hypothetical protein ES708_33226 [subsurface metagenome]